MHDQTRSNRSTINHILRVSTKQTRLVAFHHRKPMTLYQIVSKMHRAAYTQPSSRETHHLERPHSPNPDLQLSLHAFNVVKLDALPPASSRWLSPEQQELLCHADCIAVRCFTSNICSESCQCNGAYDGFVRLGGTVAPGIGVLETTVSRMALVAIRFCDVEDEIATQQSTSR
jgi:hypothetical protein